jgi:hypothetical protein
MHAVRGENSRIRTPEACATGTAGSQALDVGHASGVPYREPSAHRLDRKCFFVHFFFVPTILRIRGYRFGFYQADLDEPPHVHVKRQSGEAKVWLKTLQVAASRGFRPHELNEIARILEEFKEQLLRAWFTEEQRRGDSPGEDSIG